MPKGRLHEKVCESLKEHAMKISNFVKKKITPLTNKEPETCASQEICHICEKKSLKKNTLIIKNIIKLGIIVIIQVNTDLI